MQLAKLIALIMLLAVAWRAEASWPDKPLEDPMQERTAQAIFKELRCVVCEGQSIGESNAALAAQMRAHVREALRAGKSTREILDGFHDAYGETILLTPPFKARTWLLWLAPAVLLLLGVWLLRRATTTTRE